jgi:hypothetical protein
VKKCLQKVAGAVALTMVISACAVDPNAGGGGFSSNAAKAHIYTPEEKSGMNAEGISGLVLLPSEVRAYVENKNRVTPPTGEVNYCDAGLAQLIQARRTEALAAIAEACGGPENYRIRREGLGNLKARYVGNFQMTPSCTRSRVIVFKCSGAEPKPNMRK